MGQIAGRLSIAGTDDEVIHRNWIHRIAGADKLIPRSLFDTAVLEERARINNNGAGINQPGERTRIVGEAGTRLWLTGSDAATSHWNTVEFPGGYQVVLVNDANSVLAVSGAAPSGGSPIAGNRGWDQAAGRLYTYGSGAWDAGVLLARSAPPEPRVLSRNIPSSGSGSYASASYARTRAALARVRAKTGYMKICACGDSTQAGAYANGTTTPVDGTRVVSHIAYFAAALNSTDLPAIAASIVGDQNFQSNSGKSAALYDPRLVLGTGWASLSVKSAGGYCFSNNSTTNSLTFAPFEPCTTFDIYYATNTGLGEFTVSRTGDTTSSVVSSSAAAGVGKFTFTGALGTAPISIQRNGTGSGVYIIAIDAYSATKSIRCLNVGWAGGKVSDWIDSSTLYAPLPALQALGADLYLVQPGINEWNTAVSVSTFQANLETLVTALLTVGDVAFATGYPTQNSTISLATQRTYIAATYEVAAAHNIVVNDVWGKLGSWEAANGFGYYANALHPNSTLYRLKAELDAAFVLSN